MFVSICEELFCLVVFREIFLELKNDKDFYSLDYEYIFFLLSWGIGWMILLCVYF